MRDLLGIDFQPADDFPADDVGYGFDNIGDVLSLPPLLFEKYLAAADRIAKAAIVDPATHPGKILKAPEMQHTLGGQHGNGWNLNSNGEVFPGQFDRWGVPVPDQRLFGQQAGPDLPKMVLRIDGKDARRTGTSRGQNGNRKRSKRRSRCVAASTRLAVAFTNDFYDKDNKDPH